MESKVAWAALAVCGVLALGQPAQAGVVVYDQPVVGGGPMIRSDFGFPYECADNFALTGPLLTLTDVHWWGAYENNVISPDAFVIRLYSDVTGAGTMFYEQAPINLTKVQTALASSNGWDIYEYNADLPVSASLAANTTYWLSIVNRTTAGNWGWATDGVNSGNGDFYIRATPLDAWAQYSDAGDVAFQLTGVPEPATVTLLGLACLGGLGWRRRAA